MRVMRVITGTLLVVVALPMLVTGGALWGATRHRAPDGTFSARISPLTTSGYAISAPDLDGLLRREAPFARGGQTTLRVTATGPERLFVGIGPTADVERYLRDRSYARLNRVRLAHGPLPVEVTQVTQPVDSLAAPPPAALPFWLAVGDRSAGHTDLTWSPSSMRGHEVTLVVMNASGAAGVTADLTAAVHPGWVSPTTWALLILGTVLFVVGSAALVWRRNRDIVYVVEPAQLPQIAARLGVGTPAGPAASRRESGSEPAEGSGGSGSAEGSGSPGPAPWFARVGGCPPHASSVAPTGRRYIRPPDEPSLTASTDPGPVADLSRPRADQVGSDAPDPAGDPLPGAWPPVRADRATQPVTLVPPADDSRWYLTASAADSLLLPPWLSADSDASPVGVGGDR